MTSTLRRSRNRLLLLVILGFPACHVKVDDDEGSTAVHSPSAAGVVNSLRFADVAPGPGSSDPPRPIMQAQVILDRLGFSPGVIDARESPNFAMALRGFQEAHGLTQSGDLDAPTLEALDRWRAMPATRLVRIPAAFARGPFTPFLPEDAAEQAKLPALGYRNLMEALAERFHTTVETLVALNTPQTKVGPEQVIRVPNIPDIAPGKAASNERGWSRTLASLAVAPSQPKAASVTVDKSEAVLKVFDADDHLIAQFPATMGSEHDPLPIGTWTIKGVSRNPDFHYNPRLFWDVSDAKQSVMLKPGPNGPVGVVWIDISKAHYGIHGTSEPRTIGSAESHGCVRLTNWDAVRLAEMVRPGISAIFRE